MKSIFRSGPWFWFYGTAATLALAALAPAQAATPTPAPGQITLIPRYTAGAQLTYSVAIHSDLGGKATMDTAAEVAMRILPGATPGAFDAELRFTQFSTTVHGDPAVLPGLQQQAAATDHAALAMTPPRFREAQGHFQVLARQAGAAYDQPVEMLEELVRTDALPRGPTAVGARWSRHRTRQLPTMNTSVALTLACHLAAVGTVAGQPAATITVRSQGDAPLPPNALPNSQALAAQGLVPEATVAFDTTATSVYRLADAVLLQSHSQTHNLMRIKLVGPSPQAGTQDSDINSSATVKLEKIVN
ncbi:MAG TPA: hypothetical protein VMV31_14805 [Terriglobales bacterium]|nr:hypothetical protein [Terriglobales bacterium]